MDSVAKQFYWPGLTKDVKDYVRSCHKCQLNKSGNKTYGSHQPLQVPPSRWHTVTMNFAGPFVISGEGSWDMVLLVVDKMTKRVHLIPSKQKDTAVDTARRFFEGIVRLHGMPTTIVSDRDPKFTSLFWKSLFERLGTKLTMSSASHPQTDGQTERMVRTVEEMLRSVVNHKQNDWWEQLAAIEFAYNNSVHPSTQLSPFELDLGYHRRTPYTYLLPDVEVLSSSEFIDKLEYLQNQALEFFERTRQTQSEQVDRNRPRPHAFDTTDLVLLSSKYIRPAFLRTGGSGKLRSKYIGPFKITNKVSATSYEFDLPSNFKVHPVINIEYL
jgi:transposase InsO family protein